MAEWDGDSPDSRPPRLLGWLLALPVPVRAALLFAYAMYLAAAGVMAGLGVVGSLLGSALGMAVAIGSYLGMAEARRREWYDVPRELLWRSLAGACSVVLAVTATILVVLPALIWLALALWALASLPLML